LDVLSDGRLVAGVGPGSSKRDYDAVGVPFEDRWKRFEESVTILRALLRRDPVPSSPRYFSMPDCQLEPAPHRDGGVPLWIGSWGSPAGLRRVARLGDGWLASAYNTTPEQFVSASQLLADELFRQDRHNGSFPNALVTMWTWITESRSERERVLADVLAPLLNRAVDDLRDQVCVGSAEHCAHLLTRYAEAGCERIYLWPLGDEARQIGLAAGEVAVRVRS
jgi:alkanesulfonate monooxygenase SsuD/methylene tetrahydromethanopterin reductase-like flavin-dependent oxidoreductase (luciferase family)